MRSLFRLAVFIVVLSVIMPPAWAQSGGGAQNTAPQNFTGVPIQPGSAGRDEMSQTLQLLSQLPKQTQDRLMSEAKYAESYCATNTMLSNFYDCSCFSLHMLGERIKRGPDVPFINLIGTAQYQRCASAPAIAGYANQRCGKVLASAHIPDLPLNTICACTARALATDFAANGAPDMNVADKEFDAAIISCREKNGY